MNRKCVFLALGQQIFYSADWSRLWYKGPADHVRLGMSLFSAFCLHLGGRGWNQCLENTYCILASWHKIDIRHKFPQIYTLYCPILEQLEDASLKEEAKRARRSWELAHGRKGSAISRGKNIRLLKNVWSGVRRYWILEIVIKNSVTIHCQKESINKNQCSQIAKIQNWCWPISRC